MFSIDIGKMTDELDWDLVNYSNPRFKNEEYMLELSYCVVDLEYTFTIFGVKSSVVQDDLGILYSALKEDLKERVVGEIMDSLINSRFMGSSTTKAYWIEER